MARTNNKATVISVDNKAPLAIGKKGKKRLSPFGVSLAGHVHLLYCLARCVGWQLLAKAVGFVFRMCKRFWC